MKRLAVPALAAVAALTIAATTLVAPQARADERGAPAFEPGFYMGVGVSDANFSVTDGTDCGAFGFCDRWHREGHSDTGWTATAGYRVNRWFAIEASYIDAGKPRWDDFFVFVPSLGGVYDVESTVAMKTKEVAAVGILPLGAFDLYAKLGAAHWNGTSQQRAVDVVTNRSLVRTLGDSGTTGVAALGAGVTFAERFRARVEVRGLEIDRDLLVEPSGRALFVVADVQLQYRF